MNDLKWLDVRTGKGSAYAPRGHKVASLGMRPIIRRPHTSRANET